VDKNKDKDKLRDSAVKAVKTTMIGAISKIEESMKQGKEISFQDLRTAILDLGNKQINIINTRFDMYDVNLKIFQYNIRIGKHE